MITCHIASIYGRENSLHKTVNSIINQVDKVYVMLNDYPSIPRWLEDGKIHAELLLNELGDGAKWLHCWDEPSVCVCVDDDLILPYDFIDTLRRGMALFGGAISAHGKRYDKLPIEHYRRNFTANYRCLNAVAQSSPCHIIGTGVLMFDNQQVKFDSSLYEYKNIADVLFSRLCIQQGILMTVLAHRVGWIRYQPQKTTIWNTSQDDTIPTMLVNNFLK